MPRVHQVLSTRHRIDWLLRASFSGPDLAPPLPGSLGAPYVEIGGPLSLTDTTGCYQIASGEITPTKASTAVADPNLYLATGLARQSGRAAFAELKVVSAYGGVSSGVFPWQSSATGTAASNRDGLSYLSNSFYLLDASGTGTRTLYSMALDTYYRICSILYPTHTLHFVNETLVGVTYSNTAATMYARVSALSSNRYVETVTRFGVADLTAGPLATEWGVAAVNVATPASEAQYTGVADALWDFRFTLPASPADGDRVGIKYRIQDADNYWYAYVVWDQANTRWNFRVDRVLAGTPATQVSVDGVTGVGGIRALTAGDQLFAHTYHPADANKWAARGAILTDANMQTATGVQAVYATGTTPTRLTVWPQSSEAYAIIGALF